MIRHMRPESQSGFAGLFCGRNFTPTQENPMKRSLLAALSSVGLALAVAVLPLRSALAFPDAPTTLTMFLSAATPHADAVPYDLSKADPCAATLHEPCGVTAWHELQIYPGDTLVAGVAGVDVGPGVRQGFQTVARGPKARAFHLDLPVKEVVTKVTRWI